jgi:hypothetical protein
MTIRLQAYFLMLVVFIGVCIGEAHCQDKPPAKPVEHDPGAWVCTSALTAVAGGIYKPWVGFAAGVAWGVVADRQNSNNARQDIVGAVIGATAGYVIIKTLKHDWRRK